MANVVNDHGVEIDFKVAVLEMDASICEKLNNEIAPCSEQEFFNAYCVDHAKKYGEEFELAKENPVY